MADNLLQITKRELSTTAGNARFWIGLLCVVIVLSISAPFDTAKHFSLLQRFVYWLGIAVSTYFLAICVQVPIIALSETRNRSRLLSFLAGGLVAGPLIGGLVYIVNTQVAGIDAGGWGDLLRLVSICTVVSIAVSILRFAVIGERQSPSDPIPSTLPELLKRVSPDKRGTILTLNAQDHYVEITTSKGRELVLIRLADAIAEMGAAEGLQVHRSWWVARGAIAELARQDGRQILRLNDGRDVPVSRAQAAKVRDWLTALR